MYQRKSNRLTAYTIIAIGVMCLTLFSAVSLTARTQTDDDIIIRTAGTMAQSNYFVTVDTNSEPKSKGQWSLRNIIPQTNTKMVCCVTKEMFDQVVQTGGYEVRTVYDYHYVLIPQSATTPINTQTVTEHPSTTCMNAAS